jgi:superoxide reductase
LINADFAETDFLRDYQLLTGGKTMTKRLQVYKCELCGNMVEVLHTGAGELVCCGQPMTLQTENTVDAAREKHVPVVEKVAGGYKVAVGAVPHPMEEKHFIEWIELIAGNQTQRHFLKPGDVPAAFFATEATEVTAREFCNLHGLWKS